MASERAKNALMRDADSRFQRFCYPDAANARRYKKCLLTQELTKRSSLRQLGNIGRWMLLLKEHTMNKLQRQIDRLIDVAGQAQSQLPMVGVTKEEQDAIEAVYTSLEQLRNKLSKIVKTLEAIEK